MHSPNDGQWYPSGFEVENPLEAVMVEVIMAEVE
jgi:hypothetical protein